ncbi:MAG: polyhydroxybutyrate depolymerase [Geminicoccaceae bacterium]|nr:MAG: polyhydroxybutyrate depolymerase [Geminicoccaceae bacterium]
MRWTVRLATVGLAAYLAVLTDARGARLQPLPDLTPNPGNLDGFVYVPAAIAPGAPLVVALHGCTQRASDFDDETGLEALADAVPFVLLLPEQREANNAERCFNFFDPGHNRPGVGESASIMAMIDQVADTYALDPDRVFVLGLSAGGGMTAVLLANHPDRFAGGAVIAGVPFDCNRPTWMTWPIWWSLRMLWGEAAAASYACGLFGQTPLDRSAEAWATAVLGVAGEAPERWPLVSIWHGDADEVVHPRNRHELIEQWTHVQGLAAIPDDAGARGPAQREIFRAEDGSARVEAWRLPDLGHALPIHADAAPLACGVSGPYIDDVGLCAVHEIARFWQLLP